MNEINRIFESLDIVSNLVSLGKTKKTGILRFDVDIPKPKCKPPKVEMTKDELEQAHEFLHELWTEISKGKIEIKGEYYNRNMKARFVLLERAISEGHKR